MNGELAFDIIVRFVQTTVRQERCGCFLKSAEASAVSVRGATVISVFTHVEKHELEIGKVANGTP